MTRKLGWWFSAFVALAAMSTRGAEPDSHDDFSDYFFQRGKYEAMLMSGVMFSPVGPTKGRFPVDYSLTGVQIGWMMNDTKYSGVLRGNFELAVEAIGAAVYNGRGSYLGGGTLWLRYNFLQPNWRVVPFLQLGAGMEATDMDQRLIGQKFNFNLDVGVGARYFIAKDWALNVECRYQHISNATTASRDIGINAVGPMIGLSYFF